MAQLELARRQEEAAAQAAAEAAAETQRRREVMAETLDFILGDAIRAQAEADRLAPATRKAYRADLERFRTWCKAEGWAWLPAEPDVVASWLIDFAGDDATPKLAAVKRMVSAIAYMHSLFTFPNPCDDIVVRAAVLWIGGCLAEDEGKQQPT